MTITAKYTSKCVRCGGVILSGTRCNWDKSSGVSHINCGAAKPVLNYEHDRDHAIGATDAPARSNKLPAVTMGVFKKDGKVYVVKPNREKTRVYAKEIVESPARMTESGLQVDFEAVYRPGIVFALTEADRMDLADASDFLTKYARCIVCGRHLKAAKSVARAIGPVCAGYFKNSSHVNGCAHHDTVAPQGAAAAVTDAENFARQDKANSEMLDRDNAANAMMEMTPDQMLLLAEIKRMNRESDAWQRAEAGRIAFLLTEDIAYWSRCGINSVADFDEMQRLEDEKERRKASYDYGYDVEQPTVAESNAALLDGRVHGIKASDIAPAFRLAAIKMRNSDPRPMDRLTPNEERQAETL